jgi:hypothetical protein
MKVHRIVLIDLKSLELLLGVEKRVFPKSLRLSTQELNLKSIVR